MIRDFYKRYDNYRNVKVRQSRVPVLLEQEAVEGNSELDRITKLVFSVGDDGLPTNELSLYLGENCSSELSDYICKNIMRPVEDSNVDTSDLSDEAIYALSRGVNEPRAEYISRINNYMRSQMSATKARVERDKWFNSLKGQK